MASIRQRIEDAVIARLVGGLPYLRSAEPYNGEIDQTDGPDDLRRVLRGRSPMILVVCQTGQYQTISAEKRKFTRTLSLELYCCSNHNRTRESRNRSDVVAEADGFSDPGIYQMLEDAQQLISGSDLDLAGVGPIVPNREEALLQMDDFTAWRFVLAVPTDADVNAIGYAPDQFTDYQIDGNLVDTDGATVLDTPPNPFVESDGSLS